MGRFRHKAHLRVIVRHFGAVAPKVAPLRDADSALENVTGEEHPFHIHVNDFRAMSVNGEPYEAVGLEDTVRIPAHGQVVIRQRLHDFVGK